MKGVLSQFLVLKLDVLKVMVVESNLLFVHLVGILRKVVIIQYIVVMSEEKMIISVHLT